MLNTVSPIYDNSYVGLWLFQIMGQEHDRLWDLVESLKLQAFPQSVTWAIHLWERRYGLTPDDALSIEERRRRLLQMQSTTIYFTPESLRKYIEKITGCEVTIDEHEAPFTFRVNVIEDSSHPSFDLAYLRKCLNKIKQSHMSYRIGQGYSGNVQITTQAECIVQEKHICGMYACGALPSVDPLAVMG